MHTVHIPNWRPHTTNELLGANRWDRARYKASDAQVIGTMCYQAKIPKANGKRFVSVVMTCAQGRGLDQDAIQKSFLDALVKTGYLVDDSTIWLEFGGVEIERGKQLATTFTIGDVE